MWDTKTTGKYLNLSARTLERRRIDGTGPEFVKMGKSVRYLPSKVDEWIAKHAATSTSSVRGQIGAPPDKLSSVRDGSAEPQ